MSVVAIIPARGGSKGLVRKNVRPLAGKPLIQHSIEQARNSKCIDEVYVTTDDEEIAAVSRAFGAEIIWRPAEFSADTSSSESALLHAVNDVQASTGVLPDTIVFLQCTSPIRRQFDIDSAMELYQSENADSLLSVVESHRFYWREESGQVSAVNYDPDKRPRRQDMAPGLLENGSLYIFNTRGFLQSENRLFGRIAAYRMSADTAYEIDEEIDFVVLEILMKNFLNQEHEL